MWTLRFDKGALHAIPPSLWVIDQRLDGFCKSKSFSRFIEAGDEDLSSDEDLPAVEASNPQLGAIITLPNFLATAGVLTLAQRKIIVGQALTLIDDLYVQSAKLRSNG